MQYIHGKKNQQPVPSSVSHDILIKYALYVGGWSSPIIKKGIHGDTLPLCVSRFEA